MKEDFSIPFSLVGAPEIPEFVGRKKEFSDIEEAFDSDKSQHHVVVLHGLGGIGKTQLAVEFVKKNRKNFSAVFWLNGKDEDTLKKSFVDVAKRLHDEFPSSVPLSRAADEKDADEVIKIINQWLSIKENNRWIVIFDNVDNPKLPGTKDPEAYEIRSYFPNTHHGSILITTRSSGLKIGRVVPVRKILDVQESIKILSSTSGREITDEGLNVILIFTEQLRS